MLIHCLQFGNCAAQLYRAFSHSVFQSSALILKYEVEPSSFEEIADAQERFRLANRLHQKIRRTGVQRPSFGLFRDIGS